MTRTHDEVTVVIENDVPLPPRGSHPARLLEVGQSYFIPVAEERVKSKVANVHVIGVYTGRKFRTKRVMEGGILGIRIWRTL